VYVFRETSPFSNVRNFTADEIYKNTDHFHKTYAASATLKFDSKYIVKCCYTPKRYS